MKKSKVYYDKQSDAVYIVLRAGKEERFEEIEPNIVIEYDQKDRPIGIEILNASSTLMRKIATAAGNDQDILYKASPN